MRIKSFSAAEQVGFRGLCMLWVCVRQAAKPQPSCPAGEPHVSLGAVLGGFLHQLARADACELKGPVDDDEGPFLVA